MTARTATAVVMVLLAAAFAANVAASGNGEEAGFPDVDQQSLEAVYIAYTAARGWFGGYPDGEFRPDRVITADQMTKVLTRAFPDGMRRGDFARFITLGHCGGEAYSVLLPLEVRVVVDGSELTGTARTGRVDVMDDCGDEFLSPHRFIPEYTHSDKDYAGGWGAADRWLADLPPIPEGSRYPPSEYFSNQAMVEDQKEIIRDAQLWADGYAARLGTWTPDWRPQ